MLKLNYALLLLLSLPFILNSSPYQAPVSKYDKNDNQTKPKVEVVFALDCTGSMSGLIQTAKEKIWSIASNLTQAEPVPEIYMGMIAYRDRGDEFITKVIQLTDDLDKVYAELMSFVAAGGGDGPESVNQALHDAVNSIEWSNDANSYKTIFLVGDYPPHMDYSDDVKYSVSCEQAGKKGIVINTIQMGDYAPTTPIWREIARLTDGEFFQIDMSANAVIVSTPFDDDIAKLSVDLDNTRVYYGSKDKQEQVKKKKDTEEKIYEGASVSSIARRAVYNSSESGTKNFTGENELVQSVKDGIVKIEDIKEEELPEEMKDMTVEERKKYIEEKSNEREKILNQIRELEEKRQTYIRKELERREDKGTNSFSDQVIKAIGKQASEKDIHYKGDVIH